MKDRLRHGLPQRKNLQSESLEPQRPVAYGARKEDIKIKHLVGVLKIYGEVAGVSGFIERNGELLLAKDMKHQLDTDSVGLDLRYGSILSGHTKLMSRFDFDINNERVVKFYINPNLGYDSKDFEKGQQMAEDFNQRVNKYLLAEGIARRLEYST